MALLLQTHTKKLITIYESSDVSSHGRRRGAGQTLGAPSAGATASPSGGRRPKVDYLIHAHSESKAFLVFEMGTQWLQGGD